MAFSPLCRFSPWLVRTLSRSPPGLIFRPLALAPWLIRPRCLAESPPGLCASWLIRPLACSPPVPGLPERARGRTGKRAKKPDTGPKRCLGTRAPAGENKQHFF